MIVAFVVGVLSFAQDAERGAYLATAAGCASCHTAPDGPAWAGGYAVETEFGTFYGSNLTQDPEHGLGAWSEDDFVRAMRAGRSPDGRAYWPAFPYPSFTGMTDADLRDLYAFFRTVEAVGRPEEAHTGTRGRVALSFWRLFEFRRWSYEADPEEDPAWNRGAYLVRAVGHCGECHTPRNGIGGLRDRLALSGSDDPPAGGPNLTPHPDGLAGWSVGDLETLLAIGMTPDGDFVGGHMTDVVTEQTASLTPEDRRAMATYLAALTPLRTR